MDAGVGWLAEEWAAALASALFAMTGEQAETSAGPHVTSPPEGVGWQETLTLTEGARVFVRLPDLVCRTVGGRILQAAGLASEDEAATKDAFLEVVRQSLSQLASIVGRRAGIEVELKNGHESASYPPGFQWREVALAIGGALPACAIGASPELSAALAKEDTQTAAAATAAVALPAAALPSLDQQAAAHPLPKNSKTLDLLLEVELPIGVSFGRTQMRLKEALRLTTGSIVELNRSVTEPVEIIVNNCVIARGEVVVVEGNYGVRILEIISREERLRTLF